MPDVRVTRAELQTISRVMRPNTAGLRALLLLTALLGKEERPGE